MDRQKWLPATILMVHIGCFFLIRWAVLFMGVFELILWPIARKFAGPYWKHVILIPLFLFVSCCIPGIFLMEACHVDVSGLIILFPIASLIILCFCGAKFPQEGSVPSWQAYFLLALSYLGWSFITTLAFIAVHTGIYNRGL